MDFILQKENRCRSEFCVLLCESLRIEYNKTIGTRVVNIFEMDDPVGTSLEFAARMFLFVLCVCE